MLPVQCFLKKDSNLMSPLYNVFVDIQNPYPRLFYFYISDSS
ncbi:hypothetical protein SAMN04487894_1346 [Niabella drilacis]|uniref:Uncharacterized protein n=1 Tax=Niabella drilacis (strain DSM 25811 / CCM 8410 / CCUG 62505 / LMG 26954 / E90) TaxID=1285928 RepID=A0A1G7BUY5_NIADE|nr:hypothetical protein SAMN04487894_1346 [Niabella drilacis]